MEQGIYINLYQSAIEDDSTSMCSYPQRNRVPISVYRDAIRTPAAVVGGGGGGSTQVGDAFVKFYFQFWYVFTFSNQTPCCAFRIKFVL